MCLIKHTWSQVVCGPVLIQTVTGDTIVSSKASVTAAARRAHNKAGEKRASSQEPQNSLLLAGVEVPEPVFFCSIEPPSMAKQAGTRFNTQIHNQVN